MQSPATDTRLALHCAPACGTEVCGGGLLVVAGVSWPGHSGPGHASVARALGASATVPNSPLCRASYKGSV